MYVLRVLRVFSYFTLPAEPVVGRQDGTEATGNHHLQFVAVYFNAGLIHLLCVIIQ